MSDKKNSFPFYFSIGYAALFIFLYWPGITGFLPHEGIFHHAENVWADKLFRMRGEKLKSGDPRIILAAVDEETGKEHGFPLPRNVYARLLDKLKGYGVKTVAFDVMFLEKREHDAELIAATRRFKNVIHLYHTETKDTEHGDTVVTVLPIKGLDKASQYLGYPNIDQVIDEDGHVRLGMLFDKRISDPKEKAPIGASLDAAAIASYTERPLSELYEQWGGADPRIFVLNFRRPVTWLRHAKRDAGISKDVKTLETIDSPYQRISIKDLLSGELTAEQRKSLKGSLIIVGSTALGYFDHYPSPFLPQVPGAEYHANIIDNVLNGDVMRATARGVHLLAIIAMIWLPLLLLRFPPMAGNAAVAAVAVLWFAWTYRNFTLGVRTDFVAPLAALLSSFLVQTVYRVLTEGQEKKFIKNLFGQFVAPEVVEKLASNPALVKLGGEKRDMTMFFLDIAHFTTISEKMAPEALIIFLNKYLSALSHVVHEQQGVVDKYIGDCIMAFWNAPMELKDHRAKACLAAIECQETMARLNKDLDHSLPEVPAIRIGLNSGEVTVGLTGSEKKLQYTVIGDEVNLASRLEGANKFFGSRIIASEATYAGAKDVVEARELGRVRVVGKAVPIRVYELLAKKGGLSPEWQKALPLYNQGLEKFVKGAYAEAMPFFEEVIKIFPNDGPSFFYLNTSRDYSVLPPDNWDGVINLTAK